MIRLLIYNYRLGSKTIGTSQHHLPGQNRMLRADRLFAISAALIAFFIAEGASHRFRSKEHDQDLIQLRRENINRRPLVDNRQQQDGHETQIDQPGVDRRFQPDSMRQDKSLSGEGPKQVHRPATQPGIRQQVAPKRQKAQDGRSDRPVTKRHAADK